MIMSAAMLWVTKGRFVHLMTIINLLKNEFDLRNCKIDIREEAGLEGCA